MINLGKAVIIGMKTSVQYGFAKINLHLDITGRRDDGFHTVKTVMQGLTLCDKVTFTQRDDDIVTVDCNVSGVPLDDSNLVVRAVREYCKVTGRKIGADIVIEKNIPMAAGLAGGSADAAATLKALRQLDDVGMPIARFYGIASELGSDVPFCIAGGTALGEGKGDLLRPVSSMPECTIVVACGAEGVSTPAAYAMLDKKYRSFAAGEYEPRSTVALKRALDDGDIYGVAANMYNIFEEPISSVRPEVRRIKEDMLSGGAIGAMMSGSGPSVFGIFVDETLADKVCDTLRARGVFACVCKPHN